jgi:hypothetical protein
LAVDACVETVWLPVTSSTAAASAAAIDALSPLRRHHNHHRVGAAIGMRGETALASEQPIRQGHHTAAWTILAPEVLWMEDQITDECTFFE